MPGVARASRCEPSTDLGRSTKRVRVKGDQQDEKGGKGGGALGASMGSAEGGELVKDCRIINNAH